MDSRKEQSQENAQSCSAAKCQCQCIYHQTNTLRLESELKTAQMQLKALQDWLRIKLGEEAPNLLNSYAEAEGQILGSITEFRPATCPNSSSSDIAEAGRVNWSIQITSPFSNSAATEDGSESEVKSEVDDDVDSYFEEGSIVTPASDWEYCLSGNEDFQVPTQTISAVSTGDVHVASASETKKCPPTRQLRPRSKYQSDSTSNSNLLELEEVQCGTCQEPFPSEFELSKHSIHHARIALSRCDPVPKVNRVTVVPKKRKRVQAEIDAVSTTSVCGKKQKRVVQKSAPKTIVACWGTCTAMSGVHSSKPRHEISNLPQLILIPTKPHYADM